MLYKLLLRNDPRFLKLRISFSLSASYRKFILFFFFCSFITLAKPILPTVLAIQQHQRGKEIAVIWQSRQNIYFFFCLRHFTSFIFAGFHQDRIIFLLENLYFGFPFFFFFSWGYRLQQFLDPFSLWKEKNAVFHFWAIPFSKWMQGHSFS